MIRTINPHKTFLHCPHAEYKDVVFMPWTSALLELPIVATGGATVKEIFLRLLDFLARLKATMKPKHAHPEDINSTFKDA